MAVDHLETPRSSLLRKSALRRLVLLARPKPKRQYASYTHGKDEKREQYNDRVEFLRRKQYPMLKGIVYLDHAGTALPSKEFINAFATELRENLLANPHSALAESPSVAQQIVASTRREVLSLFNASPEHFDVIFVANATAAMKLVLEAFSGYEQGFNYYYHRDCHTSLVGMRERAQMSRCLTSDEETEEWLKEQHSDQQAADRPTLFSYPAQSNMNGRRLPLAWLENFQPESQRSHYVLLDVAAFVSTSPLDFSDHTKAPDFMSMSFYKIYGFPDLGALIVRKSAAHVFQKRQYFGGGTTEMITVEKPWFARRTKQLSESIEDGTGATHNILALKCAMKVHQEMYGGLQQVSKHTGWLAKHLYAGLGALRYDNGRPVCHIYKDPASTYGEASTQGATVAFNVLDRDGAWLHSSAVGNILMAGNIHVRSGSLCNPGGMAQALGMTADDVRREHAAGRMCGQAGDEPMPYGMVRASLGSCSTMSDVLALVQFMQEYFVVRGGQSWWKRGPSETSSSTGT